MKLKIDQDILDFEGNTIPFETQTGTRPYTFRDVIGVALNQIDQEHPLTAEKKLQAFQIGVRLFAKKVAEYDLTVDQVGFLKERIAIFFAPVVYGRFLELIGDEKVAKEKATPSEG